METRSTFSFVARGTDREPKMMHGLQELVVGHSVRHLAEQTDDPRTAAAAATMAYLTEPPIATGNDALDRVLVLRSNQPDTARALLAASAVTSAMRALDAKTRRWDWTFYPAAKAGLAEMRMECPGAMKDADTLRVVQRLMRAALEEMARSGAIAE